MEPGSLEFTFQWLNGGKELHISGLVWKIEALGRRLGIPAAAVWSKCWPYLLTRRSEAKKLGLCIKFGKEVGHKHARDTALVSRSSISSTYPTAEASVRRLRWRRSLPKVQRQGSPLRGCVVGRGVGRSPVRSAPRGRGDKGKAANPPGRGAAVIGRGRGGETDAVIGEIDGAAGDSDYLFEPLLLTVGDGLFQQGYLPHYRNEAERRGLPSVSLVV